MNLHDRTIAALERELVRVRASRDSLQALVDDYRRRERDAVLDLREPQTAQH